MQQADWQQLVIWMVIAMLLAGGGVAWWVFRQGTGRRVDRLRRAYDQLCTKLAKAGSRRLINEGPLEYYARIKDRLAPACADSADKIVQQYVRIRYGSDDSRQNIKAFLRSVKGFQARV